MRMRQERAIDSHRATGCQCRILRSLPRDCVPPQSERSLQHMRTVARCSQGRAAMKAIGKQAATRSGVVSRVVLAGGTTMWIDATLDDE